MTEETVLIGGGTGMIGKEIVNRLTAKGKHVKILTRSPQDDEALISYHKWDIKSMHIGDDILKGVDYIINLTGAGIADERWTDERKQVLIDSRVNSTALLEKALTEQEHNVKAFISASAVGFYGDRGDETLTEDAPPGEGFLSECCVLWERAADKVSAHVGRVVKIRIGTVLTQEGGALPKMLMTKSIRIFNYFGDGSQYYSWISLDDIARMFVTAVEDDTMSGVYNGVAPQPLRNKAFTRQIMKSTVGAGLLLPAPEPALRLALGEMADVILNSTKVHSTRIGKTTFTYLHKDLNSAIKSIVI